MQPLIHDNPAMQRRHDQNARLIGEFPWLWGVRQKWQFVYDRLSVREADTELQSFLYSENPDLNIEFWVYYRDVFHNWHVRRIEWRQHTPQYAHRILDYIHQPEWLEYIAVAQNIQGGDGVVLPYHTQVVIYRGQKEGSSLGRFTQTPPVQFHRAWIAWTP